MQIVILFLICFVVILFYMMVLSKKKTKGSCSCGQGNCETGETCENTENEIK